MDAEVNPDKLAHLLTALTSLDSRTRIEATVDLEELGDQRAIDPLIQALDDEDSNMRGSVISALGGFGEPAFQKLLPLLRNRESGYWRELAAAALKEFKEMAVEPLLEVLVDENEETGVRREAVYSLGETKDSRAAVPLTHILLNDPVAEVRDAAALILYKVAGNQAVGPLIKALADPDNKVRETAARSLGDLKAKDAFESLVKLLEDKTGQVRATAVFSLMQIGDSRAVEPIIPLLNDDFAATRENAAWALGQLRAKEAIEQIAPLLGDEADRVRFWAAWGLGMLGDSRAYLPMLEGLQSPQNWQVFRAAQSLGELGNPAAIAHLKQVEPRRPNIARSVKEALAKLEGQKANG